MQVWSTLHVLLTTNSTYVSGNCPWKFPCQWNGLSTWGGWQLSMLKKLGVKSKHTNTCETFRAHLHVHARLLSCLIVNKAAGCYSCGQALAMSAVIPTSVHASAKKKQVFWQSSGKKFDDCGMPPNLPRFQRFSFESIPMPDYYYCTNEILLLNKASPLFGVVAGLITLKGNQTWNWRSIMGAINRRLGLGVE